MRKDFGAQTYLYPQPVLIIASYDEKGNPDAMNAAWGGISDDHEIGICLSPEHKSVKNILSRKAFTVSVGVAKYVKECDYLGCVSGNTVPNKLEKAGLHVEKAPHVDAPLIKELPLTIECELISYDQESCHLYANIINVSVDESILTAGKIDPKKLEAISFDPVNHAYLKIGEKVGNAFKDGLIFKK
jgi:flavin reductase (DIM6/NTAB) family NADH-FMN oxidoreductase RutF